LEKAREKWVPMTTAEKCCSAMGEVNEGGRREAMKMMNPSVAAACDMLGPDASPQPTKVKAEERSRKVPIDDPQYTPTVTPGSLCDKEVKRRTGFESFQLMMLFLCVVCDGKVETMMETVSTMTWLEEWLLYFEMMYHIATKRWEDAEAH
jgi:hypothetical protein